MSDAAGVGLIGAGDMGRRVARDLLVAEPRLRVRAFHDPSPAAVSAARHDFPDAEPLADWPAVLDRADIDWVLIASPNCHHAAQTVAAFEAGKHVFCQKPLATRLEDCLAMREAWRGSGRRFVIGFVLRFTAHYRRIREIIADGGLGDLMSLEFSETLDFNHGGFIFGDWRRQRALAGTQLLEKCCHDVDLVNWIVGDRAARVASFGGLSFFTPEHADALERVGRTRSGRQGYMTWERPGQVDPFTSDKDIVDHQIALIEYANGVRASFHFNANTAIPERRMYLCGTEGTLRADLYSGEITWRRIGFGEPMHEERSGPGDLHGNGDAVLAAELAANMLDGSPCSATLDDGLAAAAVCFAIDEALDSGRVVDMATTWARIDQG